MTGRLALAAVLLILLVTLKVTGVITWSWPWVLAPAWVGAIVGVWVSLVLAILAARQRD